MESIWAPWKGVGEVKSLSLRAGKTARFCRQLDARFGTEWQVGEVDSEIDCGGRCPFRGRPLDQARGTE